IAGKRDEARKHLAAFTKSAGTWTTTERKEFIIWLLEHLEIYPITSQCPACDEPFLSQFLEPTLRDWSHEPDLKDPRPLRWLGMFFHKEGIEKDLARALAINPCEQLARIVLLGKIFDRSMSGNTDTSDRQLVPGLIAGIDDPATRDYWDALM